MAGKVSRAFLEQHLLPNLSFGEELLWGPQPGGDFAAVAVDGKQALVTACDPLAVSPDLGWSESAWLAFHLIAVDVAVSGLPPSYLTASWAFPEEAPDEALAQVLDSFHQEARRYAVQVISGHTGRYFGVAYPWVGAATAFGVGSRDRLRLPSSARADDRVLLWGTPGLEAAVLFALSDADLLRPADPEWAQAGFRRLSALDICLTTAPLPGVRCMHDITEGGLLGAVSELASAMGHGVELDGASLPVDERVRQVLQPLGLSPWEVTSCGSVLAVSSPRSAPRLVQEGFRPIGVVRKGTESLVRTEEHTTPLRPPDRDRFWEVYAGRSRKRRNNEDS